VPPIEVPASTSGKFCPGTSNAKPKRFTETALTQGKAETPSISCPLRYRGGFRRHTKSSKSVRRGRLTLGDFERGKPAMTLRQELIHKI
jgi:hypothetical protein